VPIFLGLAFAAFALGSGLAYWVYVAQKSEPARKFVLAFPAFHALVFDKWRVDEFYDEFVIGAVDSLAEFFAWSDKWIVDFLFARVSTFLVSSTGSALRFIQTGRVQTYAAVMVLGLGGVGWFFVSPRVDAKTHADDNAGIYTVSAAPGLGYGYRWDLNNDGKPDTPEFGSQTDIALNLAVKESRTVKLEVKNAFGQIASRSFSFARPLPDLSGATSRLDQYPSADGRARRAPALLRQLAKQTGEVVR
jgi:NADH-quinone oxidoreductase subunit L